MSERQIVITYGHPATLTPSEVWASWVGNQSPAEFLTEGEGTVEEIVRGYVEGVVDYNAHSEQALGLGVDFEDLLDVIGRALLAYIADQDAQPIAN